MASILESLGRPFEFKMAAVSSTLITVTQLVNRSEPKLVTSLDTQGQLNEGLKTECQTVPAKEGQMVCEVDQNMEDSSRFSRSQLAYRCRSASC